MIFSDFGGSRRPLRPIFRISGIILILEALWPRTTFHFGGILGGSNPLVECCVFDVLLSARFFRFFVILGARGSILASISGVLCEPWASEKTVKSV